MAWVSHHKAERVPLSPPERDIQISEYLFFLYICLVYSYIF